MKVVKVGLRFGMDIGSPAPKILASGHYTSLYYYSNKSREVSTTVIERDNISDCGVGIIRFKNCLKFRFGSPNDETLFGHPYYKYGLREYDLFEVLDSDWIEELKRINRVHEYHNDSFLDNYRHFVITFHDDTFECVVNDYVENFSSESMSKTIKTFINELIESD